MNLADYANIGAFLSGVASAIGLVGLGALWLQWKERSERQQLQAEEAEKEEKRYRDGLKQSATQQARYEQVSIELTALSAAQDAFANMMSERTKLYAEGLAASDKNVLHRNYLFRSASRVNIIFAARLKAWIESLSKINSQFVEAEQFELMVLSTARIAQDDRKFLLKFAANELEELSDFLNESGDPLEYFEKLGISETFAISPLEYDKASSEVFSSLADVWLEFSKK